MTAFAQTLREHPELAVFLVVALGFLVGKVRIGGFTVGNVLGCLAAGVLVGQLDVSVSPTVQLVFFDLFLFATGYKVGPQFFRGLRKDGLPQLALAVFVAVTCLAVAVTVSRLLGYDAGTAAGLLAGAFTESTIIGTATEAIQALPLPAAERARMVHQVPVAYAVTYLVGTSALVYFLSSLAPRLMRLDLPKAARELEVKLSGKASLEPGEASAYSDWVIRAVRLAGLGPGGRRLRDIERDEPGRRLFVERLRRGQEVLETSPDTPVRDGDVVAVVAQRKGIVAWIADLGEEVHDPALLDFPNATLDVVVTAKDVLGRTLEDLGQERGRGVVLRRLVRAGQEIPFDARTAVQRGDLLQVSGRQPGVGEVARSIGRVDPPGPASDMIFVGLGIFLGGLLGLVHVNVGGVAVTLTTSGGALVMGLLFGWLRSVRPVFGRISDGGLWVFDTLGLCVFIGVVGLGAGPSFVRSIRETGPSLVLAGLVVAILPHALGLLFGRYVLRMDPVILLGAESGSGTTTAALRAVQDAARSKLPVLGYTIPYAVGNILLTAWGPVVVALMR
jgi:putative transport protein